MVKNILKKNKKAIIIYAVILFISLIMCVNYIKTHYANDTYAIYNMGYYKYAIKIFLKDGRPFSCLLLLIAAKLNLSIETLVRISTIIGIAISCFSVMLIRKIINDIKPAKNVIEELIITSIAYCTIYNFMYIEILHFAEAAILSLGVFTSIYAAYQLITSEKNKVIKSFVLLLISVFSYNGTVAVYLFIVILLTLIKCENNVKKYVKNISIAIILILVTILLNYIQIKIVSNYLNTTQNRISINVIENIKYILKYSGNIFIGNITQLFPKGLFLTLLAIILTTCFLYLYKTNKEVLLKIIVIAFCGLFVSFSIHIFSTSSLGEGRLMLAMGMTIGSIFVMLYTLTDVFKANILIGNILKVLLFIYVISNIINFYVITRNHQEANKIDKNIVNEIADYIEKYEKETGITVKYATMVYFQNNNYGHYKKINSVNSLAIYSECSFDSIINFYTKKDLKRINFDDYITKRYIESIENELKPICIDDILVCPIYNY